MCRHKAHPLVVSCDKGHHYRRNVLRSLHNRAVAELAERTLSRYRNIDVLFPIYTFDLRRELHRPKRHSGPVGRFGAGVASAYQLSR